MIITEVGLEQNFEKRGEGIIERLRVPLCCVGVMVGKRWKEGKITNPVWGSLGSPLM